MLYRTFKNNNNTISLNYNADHHLPSYIYISYLKNTSKYRERKNPNKIFYFGFHNLISSLALQKSSSYNFRSISMSLMRHKGKEPNDSLIVFNDNSTQLHKSRKNWFFPGEKKFVLFLLNLI